DSQVYARQLLPEKQGYPMYYPESPSNLPLEYRKRGVGIGDLGIILPDGSFDFVFNIFIPWTGSEGEINCFGVPDGFVPLQLSPQAVRSNPDKTITSAQTVVFGFEIASSPDDTAVLTMPDGALGEDYYDKEAIRKFAITHAPSWYEFINEKLGREAPNGSLYVVTGCDRSTAWGIVTDQKTSSPRSLSLQFTA
ncbi:hypothetical protein FIBSPDRAFT_664068, partial [Athelia psychrophila]